jgi:hypothetical protein
MNCVKRIALTVLISVLATKAHAAGSDFALFSCGLKIGNTKKIEAAKPPPKKKQTYQASQTFGSTVARGPEAFTSTEATQRKTGQRRMARAFTFAKVECSW